MVVVAVDECNPFSISSEYLEGQNLLSETHDAVRAGKFTLK